MVFGAFAAAGTDYALGPSLGAHAPYVALLVGMAAGVGVNLVFAFLSTKVHVDQVIAGIGINILAVGLTYVLLQKYYELDGTPIANTLAPLFTIKGLSRGLTLGVSPLMAAMFILPVVVYFFLGRTKLGLRIRAVGENPKAAEAAGVNVAMTRILATGIGGALLGMGGAYFTIDFNPNFTPDPTGSVIPGFIALAAVIAGGWRPGYVLAMSILFGATAAVQYVVVFPGALIYLVTMLPYIVTVVVLGIASKSLRSPAALAVPYKKE